MSVQTKKMRFLEQFDQKKPLLDDILDNYDEYSTRFDNEPDAGSVDSLLDIISKVSGFLSFYDEYICLEGVNSGKGINARVVDDLYCIKIALLKEAYPQVKSLNLKIRQIRGKVDDLLLNDVNLGMYEDENSQNQEIIPNIPGMPISNRVYFLGVPSNSDYFAFSHILKGKFSYSYPDRFQKFTEKLSSTKPSGKPLDIGYMLRLRGILEDSVNDENVLSEFREDGKDPSIIVNMMYQVDNYIGECQRLVN